MSDPTPATGRAERRGRAERLVLAVALAGTVLIAAHARVPAALAALVAAVPPLVLVAVTHLTVQLTGRRTRTPAARRKRQTSPQARRRPAKASRADQRLVGEALRLRAHTSLSNREIAVRLGVHPSTVGRWIKAERAVEG